MEWHERSAFSAPVAGKAVRAAFDGSRVGTVKLMGPVEAR